MKLEHLFGVLKKATFAAENGLLASPKKQTADTKKYYCGHYISAHRS
ncbi:MAG: hypothetical protein ACRYFA_05515 [Janthinobacterium lividum]